jgi:hypothetical protein
MEPDKAQESYRDSAAVSRAVDDCCGIFVAEVQSKRGDAAQKTAQGKSESPALLPSGNNNEWLFDFVNPAAPDHDDFFAE